jgi:hypothetical protein
MAKREPEQYAPCWHSFQCCHYEADTVAESPQERDEKQEMISEVVRLAGDAVDRFFERGINFTCSREVWNAIEDLQAAVEKLRRFNRKGE